jgi:hypothetical protein
LRALKEGLALARRSVLFYSAKAAVFFAKASKSFALAAVFGAKAKLLLALAKKTAERFPPKGASFKAIKIPP